MTALARGLVLTVMVVALAALPGLASPARPRAELLSTPAVESNGEHLAFAPAVVRGRPAPVERYVAESGDTFTRVATLYGVPLELMLGLNPGNQVVRAGTELIVPSPPPPPAVLPCGDILAPVGKFHALPSSCTPEALVALPAAMNLVGGQQLMPEAAAALESLVGAAAANGHDLLVASSYRSYQDQVTTFNYWVSVLGLEEALLTSAEPGHSEHQLGTTVDLTNAAAGYQLIPEFGATAGGRWLAANAANYGFVISYPAGGTNGTGFRYEPWHIRWVGVEVARDVMASGQLLNIYFSDHWLPGRYAVN